jgi:hypothetical protein
VNLPAGSENLPDMTAHGFAVEIVFLDDESFGAFYGDLPCSLPENGLITGPEPR